MSSGSENNALVEISLALSMAFFSLMVLTMVSMGVGGTGKSQNFAVTTAGLAMLTALAKDSGACCVVFPLKRLFTKLLSFNPGTMPGTRSSNITANSTP